MFTTTNSCAPERRLGLTVLCLAAALFALPAAATGKWTAPQVLPETAQEWRVLGNAGLRWLGFRVYDAALWVPQGRDWAPDAPFALEIRYARSIPSKRLVEVSLDEMRRLGVAAENELSAWRELLAAAFPDVERDDTIIGVRQADGSVRFYHRGEATVEIDDPRFAQAFFAIWFDERTREPAMRERLLGQADEP